LEKIFTEVSVNDQGLGKIFPANMLELLVLSNIEIILFKNPHSI